MLDSEVGALLLGLLHGFLEDARRVVQFQLGYVGKLIDVLVVRRLGSLVSILVIDLCVHTGLGLVLDPLADE